MEAYYYILFGVVAFLFASVGHGGASGYLALMALLGLAPEGMRSTALALNLLVSATSFALFFRAGHFKWSLFWPFVLTSIPFSFLGGWWAVDSTVYKKVLGVILLVPVMRLVVEPSKDLVDVRPSNLFVSLALGAVIGFLSGLIGIGGGVLLSPILLMLRWSDQKQTAAVSALFIFVNSAAGLAGQWAQGLVLHPAMGWLVVVAFLGGGLGSWLGAGVFSQRLLKWILAAVLLLASVKLLLT